MHVVDYGGALRRCTRVVMIDTHASLFCSVETSLLNFLSYEVDSYVLWEWAASYRLYVARHTSFKSYGAHTVRFACF